MAAPRDGQWQKVEEANPAPQGTEVLVRVTRSGATAAVGSTRTQPRPSIQTSAQGVAFRLAKPLGSDGSIRRGRPGWTSTSWTAARIAGMSGVTRPM